MGSLDDNGTNLICTSHCCQQSLWESIRRNAGLFGTGPPRLLLERLMQTRRLNSSLKDARNVTNKLLLVQVE